MSKGRKTNAGKMLLLNVSLKKREVLPGPIYVKSFITVGLQSNVLALQIIGVVYLGFT